MSEACSPELLLENQLCFLVYRLNRDVQAVYRPLLTALGITYPQYLVLLTLWEHRSLGIGDLCRLLHLDTGTISPLVKRMEKLDLVTRTRNCKDERAVTVELTEKGAGLKQSALSVPSSMASCLLSGMEEYREVRALLERLIGRLEN